MARVFDDIFFRGDGGRRLGEQVHYAGNVRYLGEKQKVGGFEPRN